MAVNPFDVYLEMELHWRSGIPKELQGMRPKELVTLIRLAAAEGGVSQSVAASALGQSESGMSRITAKLLDRKWVTVARSTDDHKQKLIAATPKALLAMETLKGKLAAAMQDLVIRRMGPRVDKKAEALKRQYGDRTLLTLQVGDEET